MKVIILCKNMIYHAFSIIGKESNFNKVNTINLGTPYDYKSVMQYSR